MRTIASELQLEEQLSEAFSMFRCSKDFDIQNFLNANAITYEDRGWCRVYLLMNQELLSQRKFKIEAYFTLSHKSVYLQESVSGTTRSKVGYFKNDTNIHFVLIGQLGKYIYIDEDNSENNCSSKISGSEILDRAFEVIGKAHELISCRCVLVECSDNAKVQSVYKKYGFKELQYDSGLMQLYKKL